MDYFLNLIENEQDQGFEEPADVLKRYYILKNANSDLMSEVQKVKSFIYII